MFLIAGVSPRIKVLDDKPMLCPVCGLAQAYFKRIDQYFNLFFIPILRVRKGEPFIMCERCERNIHEMGEAYQDWLDTQNTICRHCGRALHRDFRYCPFCGTKIDPPGARYCKKCGAKLES